MTDTDLKVPTTVLGEMVWLYSLSPIHRDWPISGIHRWLLPPLLNKQYRIYHRGTRPVGFVTWAWLSPKVEAAFVQNTRNLKPGDWTSGDRLWSIDFIAPFGDAKHIIKDLRNNIFPNDVARSLHAKADSHTIRIKYLHGCNAVKKARDRRQNPDIGVA